MICKLRLDQVNNIKHCYFYAKRHINQKLNLIVSSLVFEKWENSVKISRFNLGRLYFPVNDSSDGSILLKSITRVISTSEDVKTHKSLKPWRRHIHCYMVFVHSNLLMVGIC